MAPVAVVSDTCSYLPAKLVAGNDIRLVSLYVHREGREERESDLTDYRDYYERLRTAAQLPTTSQPSIGDFLAVWEPLLADDREIVSLHLAAGLSGTYQSALQARDHLGAERAERVRVIDSATACGGQGMTMLAACAAARSGADGAVVAERAQAARAAMKMWFCIDTLEYLKRGGRVGAAQAWLGSALRIKPILTVESEITPIERVRTQGRAFERMVEYLRSRHDDGADAWVVQHIQAPEQAERLTERGREIFGTDPLFVSEVGPVIGTHVGPGLIGVGALPASCLA